MRAALSQNCDMHYLFVIPQIGMGVGGLEEHGTVGVTNVPSSHIPIHQTRRGEGLFLAISHMTFAWKCQPGARGSEEAGVQGNKRIVREETLVQTIIIIRAVDTTAEVVTT